MGGGACDGSSVLWEGGACDGSSVLWEGGACDGSSVLWEGGACDGSSVLWEGGRGEHLFFLFLSSNEQSTKVKNYIIDILSALVQDGDSLPQEVIDTILANILEPSKVCGFNHVISGCG